VQRVRSLSPTILLQLQSMSEQRRATYPARLAPSPAPLLQSASIDTTWESMSTNIGARMYTDFAVLQHREKQLEAESVASALAQASAPSCTGSPGEISSAIRNITNVQPLDGQPDLPYTAYGRSSKGIPLTKNQAAHKWATSSRVAKTGLSARKVAEEVAVVWDVKVGKSVT